MSLAEKLLSIQKEIGAIGKDSTNPFFKSKYFDINKLLDIVKPILNEKELLLLQPLTNINGVPAIETIIIDIDSGETFEYIMPLPDDIEPQKMGSAITYYRRYALQSFLGLQAKDDDGNDASPINTGPSDTPEAEKRKMKMIEEIGIKILESCPEKKDAKNMLDKLTAGRANSLKQLEKWTYLEISPIHEALHKPEL